MSSRLAAHMFTLQIIPSHSANPKLPLDTTCCSQIASIGLQAKMELAIGLCMELESIGLKPSIKLSSDNCGRKD